MVISGAQRLPNGDTLICSGTSGTVFEVTPDKETVWKYVNPVKAGPGVGGPGGRGKGGRGPGGRGGPMMMGGPPRQGQILPAFLVGMLELTDDQKKQLEEAQKLVDEKLAKVLTAEQLKQFNEPAGFGQGGFASASQPGKLMSPTQQASLKLADEQKKELVALQKNVDDKLGTLLNKDQKKQLEEQRGMVAGGGPGRGGPMMMGMGPGGSSLFRAPRYAPNFPGLAGKDLKPGKTVEELQPKDVVGSKN
jgi:hypothetical protein